MRRDSTGLYMPLTGDPVAQISNSELYRILYQPAQPWPYADDTADPRSIADQLGLYGYPDIRSPYYKNLDGEDWASLRSELQTMVHCPHPQDECDTFDKLKGDLVDEFRWVNEVRLFGGNLLAPYTTIDSFDIQTVYDDVKASVPVPAAQTVKMGWLSIVTDVMDTASSAASLAKPR